MAVKNVLVVDDDPVFIEVARAMLTSILDDVQISPATGGKAARALVSAYRSYDLILLDLMMPDLDGIEFLKHLHREDFRGPIVIVSGADKRLREAAGGLASAYDLNVVDTLSKPLTTDKLMSALDRASQAPLAQPAIA